MITLKRIETTSHDRIHAEVVSVGSCEYDLVGSRVSPIVEIGDIVIIPQRASEVVDEYHVSIHESLINPAVRDILSQT